MLVGDSLLAQSEPSITGELAGHQMPAVILDHATGGWGLLTALPGTSSKPADLIGQWIAEEHPDVVVVEFSGNYWPGADGPDDYLSLAWTSRWDAEAERLTRAVLATGTKLYWVIPPPRSSIETAWYGLRDLSLFESVVHPEVGLVDWWTPATTPRGALGDVPRSERREGLLPAARRRRAPLHTRRPVASGEVAGRRAPAVLERDPDHHHDDDGRRVASVAA